MFNIVFSPLLSLCHPLLICFYGDIVHYKSHPFKVYNSMVFSRITKLCNNHNGLILKYFHHPKRTHLISCHSLFSLPLTPWKLLFYLLSLWIFLFCPFHTNGIIQYGAFCFWHLSIGIMFLRFLYIVA